MRHGITLIEIVVLISLISIVSIFIGSYLAITIPYSAIKGELK